MKQILNTLYIQSQGVYLHLDHDTLKIDRNEEKPVQIPLHHLGGICVFGNVLVSPFLIHRCSEDGRNLVWLTQSGRFKARLSGPVSGNVLLRQAQHKHTREEPALILACSILAGKLQNARENLMRAAREVDQQDLGEELRRGAKVQKKSLRRLSEVSNLEELRGVEGYAAKGYFQVFNHMIRVSDPEFTFNGRNKRPPKDSVNALLSFTYALLVQECIAACEGVGLDPQMGFLHALRPGRPALALDLMEELRAPLADRFVLTLINRRQIKPKDFVQRPGGSVMLTEEGRKTFLAAYQKKKQEEVPHVMMDTKVPFGLVAHVQARLLARYLRGDVPEYQPFTRS